MNSIPLYHLSPVGRAAIDEESARIRRELADRRAQRGSRPAQAHAPETTDRPPSPSGATAEAAVRSPQDVANHP